jgi:hypothetical protein
MIENLVAGDSLSQLVQIRARNFGIALKWTGRAIEDIDTLCQEYWNRKNFNQCLWDNGLRELMLMPEYKDLPESMQAKIASIVLKARAHFELRVSQRAQGVTAPGVRT